MLRNYLTIAIRHLAKHRLFSFITIFCLAIGITFSLIIGMYIFHQEDINTPLRDVNNLYIIKSNWKVKDQGLAFTTVGPLAKAAKEEYPALVRNYYRYNPVATAVTVRDGKGDDHFKAEIAIGDTTLVSMYGFPVLYGNKDNAFPNLNSAVITETIAQKWFGRKDVLNRTFSMQTTTNGVDQDYTISAVLRDIPYNSVTGLIGTNYNIFVPSIGSRMYQSGDPMQDWAGTYDIATIELQPGIAPNALDRPFRQLLAKYTADIIKKNLTVTLAPVRDYHLKDNNNAIEKMIITLSWIAAFILLMAMINFVNITIGTSSYRLKEIGLRKVLGGVKSQLIAQFITEAWLLSCVSAIISIGLYELLRPLFNGILNTTLEPFWQFNAAKIIFIAGLTVVAGFLAGIYPAFVLSSTTLTRSIKGKTDSPNGGAALRKTLLIIQFTLAITVFICSLNVTRQISYIFNKDLGYNKEQLLVIDAYPKQWDSVGVRKMQDISSEIRRLPAVKDATLSFEVPDRKSMSMTDFLPIQRPAGPALNIPVIVADENYASTYGLQVREGSFFTKGGAHIPGQIVLNESAARALGLPPGAATGKRIRIPSANTWVTVAGVIKDYHYASLQQQIEPLVFLHIDDNLTYRYLTLKLNTPDIAKAVDDIRTKWKALSPTAPFVFSFMDDRFQSMYKSELQLKSTAGLATALNLVIVFLGIFGVVAFTLARRDKEMAVRKVLGADIRSIILLFTQGYVWPVLIANGIAWPLAYLLTDRWLANYAYRISQDIAPYLLVCLIIAIMTFVLIAAQCFKTATSNPVNSLKAE